MVINSSYKRPQQLIVNAYTLVATLYCLASSWLFYQVVNNQLLGGVHLFAAAAVLFNYALLQATKNYKRATHIILSIGTLVVVSLFTTGGWDGTGYLWTFAFLPYAYFLADKSTSRFWLVLLVLADIIVVLLQELGTLPAIYTPVEYGTFFAALVVFVVCLFFYQQAYFKYDKLLQDQMEETHRSNFDLSREIREKEAIEQDLKERAAALDKMNRLMIGRELKMVELKQQIRSLELEKSD